MGASEHRLSLTDVGPVLQKGAGDTGTDRGHFGESVRRIRELQLRLRGEKRERVKMLLRGKLPAAHRCALRLNVGPSGIHVDLGCRAEPVFCFRNGESLCQGRKSVL